MTALVTTVLWLAGHPSVAANEPSARWFTAATLSVGAADIHNSSHRNTLGTGQVIGNFVDGKLVHRREVDTVAGIGASLGVTRNRWQLETELLWRVRTDWDLSAPTPSIRTVTNVQTNISNTTLLLNLARRWGDDSRGWQWQAGFGMEVAFNQFESKYKERQIPGERAEQIFKADASSQEFAWNVSIGVARPLSPRWHGRLRYRYMDLGKIAVSGFSDGNELRDAKFVGRHSVHELQLTLVRLGRSR